MNVSTDDDKPSSVGPKSRDMSQNGSMVVDTLLETTRLCSQKQGKYSCGEGKDCSYLLALSTCYIRLQSSCEDLVNNTVTVVRVII